MAKKRTKPNPENFEQALNKLEAIVQRLEDGQIGLDEALSDYEQGVKHLRACYQLLEQAERRIELVQGANAEGQAETEPYDDALEDDLEAKSAARARRRSKRGSAVPAAGEVEANENDIDVNGRLF